MGRVGLGWAKRARFRNPDARARFRRQDETRVIQAPVRMREGTPSPPGGAERGSSQKPPVALAAEASGAEAPEH